MPVNVERIARLEKELEEARAQLWKDDAERYHLRLREIPEEVRGPFLDSLTDKRERVLFGLEAPEENRREGKVKPGTSGGDMTCDKCGKTGLTKRGLGLHVARLHKDEMTEAASGKSSGASSL